MKAKYALINSSKGTTRVSLYDDDDRPSFYPAHEELLEDVSINVENGVMNLEAKLICFECNFDNLSYEELKKEDKYILYEEYIKYPKFFKFLDATYEKHWVEERERHPFQITSNTFEIIKGEPR